MFTHRRPAPITLTSSPILSYASSSSLSSDLDYECDTPGLLTQSCTQTASASENDTPPETPIRTTTDVSISSKHLVDNRKQISTQDQPSAPHIVHTSSYWRGIDGGSQEDLGYEAEAEGRAVSSTALLGHFGMGHRRVASKPRQQRTASPMRVRDSPARHVAPVVDVFDSSAAGDTTPLTQSTPINSPTLTPTATPRMSSVVPRASPSVRSAQTAALSGLGLGLPPCLLRGDVEAGPSGSIQSRIQSAPVSRGTPSTPTITSTPRFASPLHKRAANVAEATSPILLGSPALFLPSSPPPPPSMCLLPTVLDQLPSPLELPGSQMSRGASADRKMGSPIRLRRPAQITPRSTSLTLLLKKKDDDVNDPSSPFYSPVPPSLVGSPRLKGRGSTPGGGSSSPIRRALPRRTSSSVSQYASQIRDRPGVPTGRPWHPSSPPLNTPPPGFVALPLSPEVPSVEKMSEWRATHDRFRELRVSGGASSSFVGRSVAEGGARRSSETVNPYFERGVIWD